MGVNPRFSLSTKFALLALLNVALLAVVFVVFVRWQLSEELESFLMSTARDRISSVSRSLALEMQQHDRSQWSRLLKQYSDEQGVTFMLIQTDGEVMAGPRLELPAVVQERLVRPPQRGIPGFNLFREWKGPGPPPEPPANREEELRRMQREMKAAGRELKDAGREIKEAESEMRRRYFRTIPYFNPTPPLLVVSEGATPYWVGVRLMLPPDGEGEPVRASLLLVSSTFYSNPFFFQLRPWLWIAAAATSWGVYSLLLRHRRSALGGATRLAAIIAGGVLVLIPWTIWEAVAVRAPTFDAYTIGAVVVLAVIPGVGAYGAHTFMTRELGVARTSVSLYLGPLETGLLAWWLLGEAPQWFHLAGAALILPGVWLSTRPAPK